MPTRKGRKTRVELIKQLYQSSEISAEVACKYLPEGETRYLVEVYEQKRKRLQQLRKEMDEAAKDYVALTMRVTEGKEVLSQ